MEGANIRSVLANQRRIGSPRRHHVASESPSARTVAHNRCANGEVYDHRKDEYGLPTSPARRRVRRLEGTAKHFPQINNPALKSRRRW
jgi:hypothetical protein